MLKAERSKSANGSREGIESLSGGEERSEVAEQREIGDKERSGAVKTAAVCEETPRSERTRHCGRGVRRYSPTSRRTAIRLFGVPGRFQRRRFEIFHERRPAGRDAARDKAAEREFRGQTSDKPRDYYASAL